MEELKSLPIAVQTSTANEQHYEVSGIAHQNLLKRNAIVTSCAQQLSPPPSPIVSPRMQVPTEYFLLVLGKHLKYSSCYYPTNDSTLDDAELAMLGMSK